MDTKSTTIPSSNPTITNHSHHTATVYDKTDKSPPPFAEPPPLSHHRCLFAVRSPIVAYSSSGNSDRIVHGSKQSVAYPSPLEGSRSRFGSRLELCDVVRRVWERWWVEYGRTAVLLLRRRWLALIWLAELVMVWDVGLLPRALVLLTTAFSEQLR